MIKRRNIPNLLTIFRLVLAGGLFVLLAFYRYDTGVAWLLIPAIILFIAAAVTDALDGYYARKWEVVSKFGRIMDPFCDKVLVLGALMFLAGPAFTNNGYQVSGVYPWMVVLILARELLVTGIRGEMESGGHQFGANVWGKFKMILQSLVVPAVLLLVWLAEVVDMERSTGVVLLIVRTVLVYATVVVTLLSGLPYVVGAARIVRAGRDGEAK